MTTGGEGGERGGEQEPTFADVLNGFSFDSGRRRGRKRRHELSEEPEPTGQAWAQPHDDADPPWPDEDDDFGAQAAGSHAGLFDQPGHQVDELSDAAAIVRPYAWTGGRTKANQHLELETLVSTSDSGWDITTIHGVEHRSVAELCKHPHAVAEVAAKLSVPLGVARVLLSDMADLGLITVHQTVAEDDDTAAQLMLMERVLSGLRRL